MLLASIVPFVVGVVTLVQIEKLGWYSWFVPLLGVLAFVPLPSIWPRFVVDGARWGATFSSCEPSMDMDFPFGVTFVLPGKSFAACLLGLFRYRSMPVCFGRHRYDGGLWHTGLFRDRYCKLLRHQESNDIARLVMWSSSRSRCASTSGDRRARGRSEVECFFERCDLMTSWTESWDERLQELALNVMEGADLGHDLAHVERVVANARDSCRPNRPILRLSFQRHGFTIVYSFPKTHPIVREHRCWHPKKQPCCWPN